MCGTRRLAPRDCTFHVYPQNNWRCLSILQTSFPGQARPGIAITCKVNSDPKINDLPLNCDPKPLLRWSIEAFIARGTGHQYLFVISLVAGSFRWKVPSFATTEKIAETVSAAHSMRMSVGHGGPARGRGNCEAFPSQAAGPSTRDPSESRSTFHQSKSDSNSEN